MSKNPIAFDPSKVLADGEHLEADYIEIAGRLGGTSISNPRLVMALMLSAQIISGRDEESKQAFRAMLMFMATLAMEDAE